MINFSKTQNSKNIKMVVTIFFFLQMLLFLFTSAS